MATADPADAVFAALSDGTRRSLYATLGERGEATATDLARALPVTRQAVHKHLGTLAAAGLVATRREGREVLYRPTPAPMSEALAWMAEVGAQWDDRLAALERQLARGPERFGLTGTVRSPFNARSSPADARAVDES
jgi:DNA-binding transcriptional ArsR family regulator